MKDIFENNWQRVSILVGGVLFGLLAHGLRDIDAVENLYISLNSWKIYYCSLILVGMFVPTGLILFFLKQKYKRVERDMDIIQAEIDKIDERIKCPTGGSNKDPEENDSDLISRQARLKSEWESLNEKHTRIFLWIFRG